MNVPSNDKRKKALIGLSLIVLLTGFVCFGYEMLWGRYLEYTDDAYVAGNCIYIPSQVEGIITDIETDDTREVKEGQIVIRLDTIDAELTLEKKKEELANTVRNVAELFSAVEEKKAIASVAKTDWIRAAGDFERRTGLTESGSISEEDFTHATASLTRAYFSLVAAEQEVFRLLAQTENTDIRNHPRVQAAVVSLKEAWILLKRTTIRSPQAGVIAQRKAQVGKRVRPGDPLLAVVPLGQIWIDANFKETQIGSMKIGQKAIVRSDIYGRKVTYEGVVVGIGAGTGSVFSLLPPQNATGNWIKIVQRVPVRIALRQEQIRKAPLRLGLSVEVTVKLDSEIEPVSEAPGIIYGTGVFRNEEEGIEPIIEEIFEKNLPPFLQTEESVLP